jgi:hypothetical protein
MIPERLIKWNGALNGLMSQYQIESICSSRNNARMARNAMRPASLSFPLALSRLITASN